MESNADNSVATTDKLVKQSKSGFFETRKGRSKVKHALLRRYFDAWLPIVSQAYTKYEPYYIDGFSGPGMYRDGTEGSPILVYTAAVDHVLSERFTRPVRMIFIEFEEKHADSLKAALEAKQQQLELGGKSTKNVKYEVRTGQFHIEMEKILEAIGDRKDVALLAFVDPCGFKGSDIPMTLMRKIMQRAKHGPAEVFINLMNGFANRFFKCDSRAKAIHELLGTEDWKQRILPENEKLSPAERLNRFMDIYIEELRRETDQKLYPLKFGMRNEGNRHIYTLLFVTRHVKGLEEMKRSMWKQTQSTDGFQFSEFVEKKNTIPENFNKLTKEQQTEHLTQIVCQLILEEFEGKGQVKGSQLDSYILESTIYLFNVKRQMRKLLKRFVVKSDSKFENIIFSIPNNSSQNFLFVD